MAFEIKNKDTLLNDLNKIKEIAELPSLYLSNYFMELKNDVDREFAPKQLELQNDKEKKKELNELWQQMIEKIDTFEKSCIKSSYDLETHRKRINEMEEKLNKQKTINLNGVKEIIESEEINLLKILFENKTILFLENQKLIIINDEFISKTTLGRHQKHGYFVLDNQLIKLKIMKDQVNLDLNRNICDFYLDLSNLQELYLQGKQIREIKENSFNGLNNLQKLYLWNNQITEIKG